MEEEEEEEEEEGVKRVQCRHWNGREHGKCIGKGGRICLWKETGHVESEEKRVVIGNEWGE